MGADDSKLRRQIESMAVTLSQEFAGKLPSDAVDRCLAEELAPFTDARVREFVPILAERRLRSRLRALAESG